MPVWQQLPTDIKRRCSRRFLPPFQDVAPPRIARADRHVIGNEIEDQAELGLFQSCAQPRKCVFATKFGRLSRR